MNKIKHKDCGGEIIYINLIQKAMCIKCQFAMSSVDELLRNISIMKLDDNEVILSSIVKENE